MSLNQKMYGEQTKKICYISIINCVNWSRKLTLTIFNNEQNRLLNLRLDFFERTNFLPELSQTIKPDSIFSELSYSPR